MEEKNRLRNLGINIKSERLRRNISQEKLAELTNISRNSISLIETGKINPTILKVIDIARVLNVDLNTLIRARSWEKKYYDGLHHPLSCLPAGF